MSDVIAALGLLLQPATLLMCFVGMLVGLVLGAIPGLAAGLAITVMLPISFTMEPTQAFALLMSIWGAAAPAPSSAPFCWAFPARRPLWPPPLTAMP